MNSVSFNLCVFFFEDLLNTEDFLQLSYCHCFSNLYTSLTRGGHLVPENLVLQLHHCCSYYTLSYQKFKESTQTV